jgi:hypothetical protein
MADRITLFISRDGAERAGNAAINRQRPNFRVIPATLRDDDTGHIERGFRVAMLNSTGHPVASL